MAVCWTKHATVSWHPCCAAVLVPPPPMPPDRCDGHNCARMSSSGSGTRTASRRLIIPNKAAPARKQSCRQPPKTRCDSVSPSMPRLFDSLVRWNLSARDIALRVKGGNLLQRSEATVKQVAGTTADRSCPPRCSIVTNFTSDSEAGLGTRSGRDDGSN